MLFILKVGTTVILENNTTMPKLILCFIRTFQLSQSINTIIKIIFFFFFNEIQFYVTDVHMVHKIFYLSKSSNALIK